mmetsp:Transcript_66818/g.180621  ORF Transcript_66818/g.180621 Transcript_66818/m.180621 type:complete len:134 (-) Transcript_66818:357-758(-)
MESVKQFFNEDEWSGQSGYLEDFAVRVVLFSFLLWLSVVITGLVSELNTQEPPKIALTIATSAFMWPGWVIDTILSSNDRNFERWQQAVIGASLLVITWGHLAIYIRGVGERPHQMDQAAKEETTKEKDKKRK